MWRGLLHIKGTVLCNVGSQGPGVQDFQCINVR